MCSKSCDLSWLHCASVHCTVQGFIKCKVIEESLEIIPAVLSNWLVCQTPEFGKPKLVIFSKLLLGLFFFYLFVVASVVRQSQIIVFRHGLEFDNKGDTYYTPPFSLFFLFQT